MFVVALHERQDNGGTHYSYTVITGEYADEYYQKFTCGFLDGEFSSPKEAFEAGDKWHKEMIKGPYSAVS